MWTIASIRLMAVCGAAFMAGLALELPAPGMPGAPRQGSATGSAAAQLSPEQKVAFIQSVVLIGSAYREWSRAYTSKSAGDLVRWLDRHCTPDFSVRSLDGRSESRKDLQAQLTRTIPALRTAAPAETKPERISILKDTATVLVSFRYSDATSDRSGKVVPRSGQRFTRDTWVRKGQQWLLRRSEELRALPAVPQRTVAPAGRQTARPVRP